MALGSLGSQTGYVSVIVWIGQFDTLSYPVASGSSTHIQDGREHLHGNDVTHLIGPVVGQGQEHGHQ